MIDATGMPQTAVVVGGTSDIARALLRALSAERLRRVLLAGRDQAGLETAANELRALGIEATVTVYDVTDVSAHARVAGEATADLGDVDLVVVAAGILGDHDRAAIDPVATAAVLDTNCTGPAAAMTAFADVLRRQGHGRLVVLSSVAGVRVRKANYVYGASKAGLDGFAQGLADTLVGSGASVVIVRPGWVATRMTAGMEPGPMATTAEAVAADIVTGLRRGAPVIWSPAALRFVFAVLKQLPAALWRRMPA